MANVIFRPTCSKCHRVLWGQTININYNADAVFYKDHTVKSSAIWDKVSPRECPYCGEPFNALVVPVHFPVSDIDLLDVNNMIEKGKV